MRFWFIEGAGDQLVVAGSYSSALERPVPDEFSVAPPATSTLPLGSSVAVCSIRAAPSVGPAAQAPADGSSSSQEPTKPPFQPPATSTLPRGSIVAVSQARAVRSDGPAAQLAEVGL